MLVLRWILGVVITLLGSGLLFLFIGSNGFRRSFGASETHPVIVVLPMLAFAVLVAGLIFPGNKPLLHTGAVAAVGLAIFCIWMIVTESAMELLIALILIALWFFYYWQAVFHQLR